MYFDFDDRYRDIEPVGSAINRRDGVAVSVMVHGLILAALLFLPQYIEQFLPAQAVQPPPQQQVQREDKPMFVFVDPRTELPPSRTPDRVEMSDLDRSARSPDKAAPVLENPLPMAKGNSSERTETTLEEKMKGEGPAPTPAPQAPPVEMPSAIEQKQADTAMMQRPQRQPPPPGGSLGEALKDLQKYVQNESFSNQKGQTQEFGPLQFDTKGVEFGPWVRRFVQRVRSNWFVPMAAQTMRGHVVITFFVHKSGALTDITVIKPSAIESFNVAAVNALRASNPVIPLPAEYPDDKAFFTVTFYYNESPQGQ
jgi:TonB family protein